MEGLEHTVDSVVDATRNCSDVGHHQRFRTLISVSKTLISAPQPSHSASEAKFSGFQSSRSAEIHSFIKYRCDFNAVEGWRTLIERSLALIETSKALIGHASKLFEASKKRKPLTQVRIPI